MTGPIIWLARDRSITLKVRDTLTTLWGIGLSADEEQHILEHAGAGFKLRNWFAKRTPGVKELQRDEPLVLWIPLHVWNALGTARKRLYQRHDSMQRVLLLQNENNMTDLEDALGAGFMEIVKTPLEKRAVENILERATEMKSLYGDIFRMTQEIYLERELLARKNEHLSFINRFVGRAAESLDAVEILSKASEDLDMLFPVKLVQGVVWSRDAKGRVEAELYLNQDLDSQSREEWIEFLTESAAKLIEGAVDNYRITLLQSLPKQEDAMHLAPQRGRVAILPLNSGKETFGCLVLLSEDAFRLGRDQVELLHSATKHLALALRNAQLFNEARTQAQFDGLTKLYNRKHFDSRLEEELSRHKRYAHKMSVIMVDLDYFKSINDEYGHQAGDMVLKEMGRLLQESVRTTDFAARYGGEEFALILPQTDENQAWILAERIRLSISKKSFTSNGKTFEVTASMGIATLQPGSLKPKAEIMREADEALYTAKSSGRNMVVISNPEEDRTALMQA